MDMFLCLRFKQEKNLCLNFKQNLKNLFGGFVSLFLYSIPNNI